MRYQNWKRRRGVRSAAALSCFLFTESGNDIAGSNAYLSPGESF